MTPAASVSPKRTQRLRLSQVVGFLDRPWETLDIVSFRSAGIAGCVVQSPMEEVKPICASLCTLKLANQSGQSITRTGMPTRRSFEQHLDHCHPGDQRAEEGEKTDIEHVCPETWHWLFIQMKCQCGPGKVSCDATNHQCRQEDKGVRHVLA